MPRLTSLSHVSHSLPACGRDSMDRLLAREHRGDGCLSPRLSWLLQRWLIQIETCLESDKAPNAEDYCASDPESQQWLKIRFQLQVISV